MRVHFDSIAEGMTEILTVVAQHPKHIIGIAVSEGNPYCRPSMLKTLLDHTLSDHLSEMAGIKAASNVGDSGYGVIGYEEPFHDLFRKYACDILNAEKRFSVAKSLLSEVTVFVPTENGLQLFSEHTAEYVPFVRSLKIGDKVRCIINGIGEVIDITTDCCDNDNLKPGDRPMSILTIVGTDTGGAIWRHTYSDDGTCISQACVGRTLRPLNL